MSGLHVTIAYPHPKPKRRSDVGAWCVTVKQGKIVETATFSGDDAERKANRYREEVKKLAHSG